MSAWTILAGVIAPVAFWMAFIYHKDRLQPEPFPLLLSSYALGVVAGVVAVMAHAALAVAGLPEGTEIVAEGAWWESLGYSFLAIGVLEEVVKFIPFWLVCLRFKEFDEEIDGIVYASSVALGFATLENLFVLRQLEGFELYARAYASPLVHTIFASIWGHACARSRIRGGSLLRAAVVGLLVASAAHGLYDFLALRFDLAALAAAVILAIWIWRLVVIGRLQKKWHEEHGARHGEE